jgi:hypothetical protein
MPSTTERQAPPPEAASTWPDTGESMERRWGGSKRKEPHVLPTRLGEGGHLGTAVAAWEGEAHAPAPLASPEGKARAPEPPANREGKAHAPAPPASRQPGGRAACRHFLTMEAGGRSSYDLGIKGGGWVRMLGFTNRRSLTAVL